jgi:nucleoid-associated protein YgaU
MAMICGFDSLMPVARRMLRLSLALCFLLQAAACNRLTTPRRAQLVQEADAREANGDFMQAVGLYEAALDGTAASADTHYRLALLYDDKMKDPFNALHHFKRYLALAPEGPHAADARTFMKRDELVVLTNLSGDTVLSRADATRLRNENLALRQKMEELRVAGAREPIAGAGTRRESRERQKGSGRKPGGTRSYVVESGDTLASISRKFYKTSSRWKEIREANTGVIDDPKNLKIGTRLTIP